jgi:hypothetical protein
LKTAPSTTTATSIWASPWLWSGADRAGHQAGRGAQLSGPGARRRRPGRPRPRQEAAARRGSGSTFTLTNSGIFGEEFGTPIINQPESAILAIGGLRKEPVVLTDAEGNDTIAIRSMQYFCLGFDHRTIDGADAGKFMVRVQAHAGKLEQADRVTSMPPRVNLAWAVLLFRQLTSRRSADQPSPVMVSSSSSFL